MIALSSPTASTADPLHEPTVQVTFGSPGQKTVTLTVCNPAGCSASTQTVQVLDPGPTLGQVSVAPLEAEVGELVLLEAQASGQPTLSSTWQILQGGIPLAAFSGASAGWDTRGLTPGSYTVVLTVRNPAGAVTAHRTVLLRPAQATDFYTVPPCRLLDTRGSAPLASGGPPRRFAAAGLCG
ncbi:MAG: hypothetical protein M3O15_03125, partial [Acidobacteriota bacterium]|nr:hypothetical protein [Acidobacteriota bacterium]